jgi:hypothetical protein
MITSNEYAKKIFDDYETIRKRGGHAAIDYRHGELVLQCTKPLNDELKTWGRGAVPMEYTPEWVRLVQC